MCDSDYYYLIKFQSKLNILMVSVYSKLSRIMFVYSIPRFALLR